MTAHAALRAQGRDVDPKLIPAAEWQASRCNVPTAIRMLHQPATHPKEDLWIIVREHTVQTWMWRAASRRDDPDAFHVMAVEHWN